MNHLKIVGTLTLVVVLFTSLVFIVESYTGPQIEERLVREANEAKFEVLPSLNDEFDLDFVVPLLEDEYDYTDTTILNIYYVEGHGYIYEAQFQGYQSQIRYMVGINEDGVVTGLKVLEQGDTPGLGAEIANPDNWEQFVGMSLNTLLAKDFDGLSGATVTTTGWKNSLALVADFHLNTVLGYVYTDVTSDVTVSGVVKAQEVSKNGSVFEVNYTVEFESDYSNGPNTYFVTFKIGQGIKSLQVINATDTDIYGAHIGDPEFAAQFDNMSLDDALAGLYDDLGGATYPRTLEAFGGTFDPLVAYHNVNYEGALPETEAEMIARYKEELSVKGGTITDVTADYDLTDTYITKIEAVTPSGETEEAYVIIAFTFPGYIAPIDVIMGMDLDTNRLTGLRVLAQNETEGIGDRILEEEFLAQFDDFPYLGAKYGVYDAIGGSSRTTGSQLTAGFENVLTFYEEAFMGLGEVVSELTEAQILQQKITNIFPEQFSINDISSSYTLISDVQKVLRVNDIDGNVLGYVFLAEGEGASYDGPTTIEYMLAINPDKTFAGFELFDDNETPGRADPYYLVEYATQFVGLNIEELDYPIDEVGGSTLTHVAIMESAEAIARFFVEEVMGSVFARPEPTAIDQAILEDTFPGATEFTSIYSTLPYSEYLVNVYEAREGGILQGYVYIGEASGKGATKIQFAWGINETGITEQIEIISHSETWQAVVDCGEYCTPEYDGTDGIFPATPWLASQFEGIDIANITTTAVIDDISGVSITTTGMREAAEAIVAYHNDNVGGAS